MGWFYGFKLHLIVNHHGGIVAAKVTPANVHDTKPVNEMVHSDMNKLYADKGYISKALSSELLEKGLTLVTNVRNNMKAKAISLWGRAMLLRRFIIETINDHLKKHLSNRALKTPLHSWFYAEYDCWTHRLSIER